MLRCFRTPAIGPGIGKNICLWGSLTIPPSTLHHYHPATVYNLQSSNLILQLCHRVNEFCLIGLYSTGKETKAHSPSSVKEELGLTWGLTF